MSDREEMDAPECASHTEECQLRCEHCHHGSDCFRTCCLCGAVRDGEGIPSWLECTCLVELAAHSAQGVPRTPDFHPDDRVTDRTAQGETQDV